MTSNINFMSVCTRAHGNQFLAKAMSEAGDYLVVVVDLAQTDGTTFKSGALKIASTEGYQCIPEVDASGIVVGHRPVSFQMFVKGPKE